MTREEREKAIDALKISAPVMAVTQEEFNDYIQTLNKIMDWLEQEPCTDAISRQAAIDACLNGWNKDYKEIVKEIRALPPVTPQYTEAEIQKMQDLEFAEIQTAYEIGKAEGSEVLDKIRAEIIDTLYVDSLIFGELMEFKEEKIGADDVIEEFNRVTRAEVLQIIDKYKAESEVQDASCD